MSNDSTFHRHRRDQILGVVARRSALATLAIALRQLGRWLANPRGGNFRAARRIGVGRAILFGMLGSVNPGMAALVRIRLETTDLSSNVVSSVSVGGQFLLRGYVTDLRPNPQGVFAAYLNVDYAPASSVSVTGAVNFIAPFTLASSGSGTNAGLISELGSTALSLTGSGGGEKPQFNVRLRANAPGVVTFSGRPAEGVAYAVLLFGIGQAIPPDQIEFVNPTIAVTGIAAPSLRINRIEVRTNGISLSISGPQNATVRVQSVTNLTNPGWQNLGDEFLLSGAGTAGFFDFGATNHPTRYYRVYQP